MGAALTPSMRAHGDASVIVFLCGVRRAWLNVVSPSAYFLQLFGDTSINTFMKQSGAECPLYEWKSPAKYYICN